MIKEYSAPWYVLVLCTVWVPIFVGGLILNFYDPITIRFTEAQITDYNRGENAIFVLTALAYLYSKIRWLEKVIK